MGRKLNREIEQVTVWGDFVLKYLQTETQVTIASDSNFDDTVPEIYNSYNRVNSPAREEMAKADLTIMQYALAKWSEWKTVYIFDEVFLSALRDTEDTQIHADILKRLPFSSFYAHTPKNDIAGYFITIEPNDGDCLVVVTEIKRGASVNSGPPKLNDFGFSQCSLWFKDGQTIGEALGSLIDSNEEILGDRRIFHPEAFEEAKKSYIRPINLAILCAYYLASQNADVKPLKIDKQDRPRRANSTPLNIKAWEVGFRMGQTIGKMYGEKKSDGKPRTASVKRPHVRRAHWHHYWAGKGRTELRLNWVLPTIINASAGELPAVGHKVIKEESN